VKKRASGQELGLHLSTPIHSSRIGRGRKLPRDSLSCVALPDVSNSVPGGSCHEPSYPEGNFEGNQLLDGSIGLSPLCRTQATQFARQNSDRLPPQFPTASSWNGIVHHLSGPMDHASTQNPVHWTSGPVFHAAVLASGRGVAFTLPWRLETIGGTCQPACSIDSLVRVTRRAEGGTGSNQALLCLSAPGTRPQSCWHSMSCHRSDSLTLHYSPSETGPKVTGQPED